MKRLLAFLLLLPGIASAQMISQLPPASSVGPADYTILVVPGSPNVDYRATIAQIFTDPTVTGGMSVTGGLSTDTLTIAGVPFTPGGGGGGTTGSSLTITGNGTIGGTFGVTGVTTLTGNTTVGGTFGVTGAANFATTVVNGPLGVTGSITGTTESLTGMLFGIGATFTGAVSAATLNVTGATSFPGGLIVGSGATITGAVGVTGSLSVSGNFGASGTSNVAALNATTVAASAGMQTTTINASGYFANGNSGQTCSGAPSGAFATNAGIVIHC